MNKTLVILILAVIVLSWNFIFTSEKKVDLTDQAKVLQGLSMAIKYKVAVKNYWKEKGVLPDSEAWQKELKNNDIDISKSLVKGIEVGVDAPGAISVIFMNKETIKVVKDINDKKIVLTPEVQDKRLEWRCTGNIDQDLLPKRCQYIKIEE